jgi:hypothetical protein
LVKQPQDTHRLCQEVCQAYHPGYEGTNHITESVVTTEGAANHVELNQLDASQGPKVPMFNEIFDVLLEELPVMLSD